MSLWGPSVGRRPCLNHSSLALSFPSLANRRGSLGAHQKCSTWEGECAKSGLGRKWTRGIFCANFYWSMNDYAPCRQIWCGGCYTSSPNILFPVKTRVDQETERGNDPLLQERMISAWGKKHRSADDFLVGRDGDHLLVPFECDLCIFRKLKRRNPLPANPQDDLMLACIRRANLDSFWSRAKSTVLANRDKVAFGIKMSATMGLLGPYKSNGSLPEDNHCGYEVAFEMLLHSQRPGSYSESYTPFETVRKLRSAFSNHCRASAKANRISMALGDQKGRYLRFATDPCSLFWFYCFIEGARTRMGQDWRPNKAISINLLLLLIESADLEAREAVSLWDKNRWVVFHTYVVVCYTILLRG
jgi:hypothetical protein